MSMHRTDSFLVNSADLEYTKRITLMLLFWSIYILTEIIPKIPINHYSE